MQKKHVLILLTNLLTIGLRGQRGMSVDPSMESHVPKSAKIQF